jgi:hypothetical protein
MQIAGSMLAGAPTLGTGGYGALGAGDADLVPGRYRLVAGEVSGWASLERCVPAAQACLWDRRRPGRR